MASKRQINIIKSLAIKRGLDPAAVLAVARQEGLGGGIGDQGTSFGPFQLHVGGAFPSGVRGNRQAWAWSPVGLNYALSRIASVAGGLHGGEAINAIVRRFERPAAPDNEVAGALAAYGQTPSAGIPAGNPLLGSSAVSAPINGSNPLLDAVLHNRDLLPVIRRNAIMASANPLGGSGFTPKPLPYTQGTPNPVSGLPGILGQIVPAELLNEGTGGATHSTGPHIHVAYTNPQAVLAAIRLAQSLGLSVGENPYVGGVDPVHAKNSYHYRTFPGLYSGKHLGEAIDVSGKNAQRFYRMLSKR